MNSKFSLLLAIVVALGSARAEPQPSEPIAIEHPTVAVMKLRNALFAKYEKEIEAFDLGVFPAISDEIVAALTPELVALEAQGNPALTKRIQADIERDLEGIDSGVFYRGFRSDSNYDGVYMHSAEERLEYIDNRLHYVVRQLKAGDPIQR